MKRSIINAITIVALAFLSFNSNAQIINPGRKALEKGEQRANDRIDRTIDKGLDKIDEGLDNMFNGKEKKEEGFQQSQHGEQNTYNSNSNQNKSGASSSDKPTDFSKYKNFDFIPGKNILFFDDFSDGSTKRWKAYDAAMYSVNNNWLEIKGTRFTPINLGILPEDITIEMDAYVLSGNHPCGTLEIQFVDQSQQEQLEDPWFDNSSSISISPISQMPKTGLLNYSRLENNETIINNNDIPFKTWQPEIGNTHVRISITRKGNRISLYLNSDKIMDNVDLLNNSRKYGLTFNLQNYFVEETRMYITNVRIASGAPHATSEVKSNGKFVTNTIYFDVNSSRIKPESWATLKQSAEAIKAYPGNYLIVGHTDSDGADDTNLKLSQSRAASVKNALVREFGIDASKLTTDGKGESQPIDSNNTANGKAKNRRVEFVFQ